jgi:hypothetical protein
MLVPKIRFGRWLTAFLLFALLYVAFRWARVFQESDEAGQAAALFFSVIVAYIVPVYHLITENTLAAFRELESELIAEPDQIQAWRDRIAHKSAQWTWSTLVLGAAAGLGHNVLLAGSPTVLLQRLMSSLPAVAIALGVELVWVVMVFAVAALLDNARLFNRLSTHTRIHLLDPSPLTAFARVAVASTLALIGAQASFPLLWVSPTSSAAEMIPGLLATATPMFFLFILPIWPIHRAIAAAKSNELKRINARLRSNRRVDESVTNYAQLNELLTYRREITEVSEWPFNASVTTRLVFYLVIPPLTWVAAGLINVIIERLI